jgi:transposase
MTKHKSNDLKLSAVNYYLTNNVSQIQVCRIFNCSSRSLMRWVEKFERNGNVEKNNRLPLSYKVTKEHANFLLDTIKKDKTITMKNLLIKLKEKFDNINLCRYHVNRIIKDNNITLKHTRIRHEPNKRFGKNINITQQLKDFYNKIKQYSLNDIICIDETSISSLQKRKHCYNTLGKRCVIKTSSQEVFKKYTGIFAISTNGVIGYNLYKDGGIDSDRLFNFLEKYVTTKFKNKLIILDNASSHRNIKIKELIEKYNNILYSVPYQHYTNAIEQFFSMLKSHLQKLDGLTYENLNKNILDIINVISKEKYMNIIKGSYDRNHDDRYSINK